MKLNNRDYQTLLHLDTN